MTAVEHKKIDWFDKNPYLNHLGFEVMVQDGKDIIVKLSIDSRHLNIQQNLHGGVHASMLDTIQTVALRTVYQTNVTALNLNVHYVTGINHGLITANARIIQQGYKIAAVESEIVDERGELIAKGSGVYKITR
ncbi:MAG: PaaI family thioesterase [Bacillota bacterium]